MNTCNLDFIHMVRWKPFSVFIFVEAFQNQRRSSDAKVKAFTGLTYL